MIPLKQREHANGYLDVAMTPNEMLDKGEALFQRRRREIVSAKQLRGSISRFDDRGDEESQAADKRADMVERRTAAETSRVEVEIAIKNYILEAAEIIKAERGDTTITNLRKALWAILCADIDNHIPDELHTQARAALEVGK